MKRTWPIIGVRDVPGSFRWYRSLFGQPETSPAHDYFGQILDTDGTVLLCLHRWGAHEHPSLMSPGDASPGSGLLLFFRVDDYEMALKRARALVERLDEDPHVNPNTQTREFSLRDPDGYYVTISALSPPPGKATRKAAAQRAPADQGARPNQEVTGANSTEVSSASSSLQIATALLGGRRMLRRQVMTETDVHELVLRGIPVEAMAKLFTRVLSLSSNVLLAAVGISERSFARRKAAPRSRLPIDVSERLWRIAEVLGHATRVFGSQAKAERWLGRPAIGLGHRKPIDLLRTHPGTRLVTEYLSRIEHGIYV